MTRHARWRTKPGTTRWSNTALATRRATTCEARARCAGHRSPTWHSHCRTSLADVWRSAMRKWKWLCGFASFSIAMVSCTMRDVDSPATAADEGRTQRESPTAHHATVSPGISRLSSETDRTQFDTHLTDQLAA